MPGQYTYGATCIHRNFFISAGYGRILKITADGKLTVVAGTSGTSGATDGAGGTALFNNPTGGAMG